MTWMGEIFWPFASVQVIFAHYRRVRGDSVDWALDKSTGSGRGFMKSFALIDDCGVSHTAMLTAANKRKLRQSEHHLKPVVLIGQHGVTGAVIAEIERALSDRELIKVRFRGIDRAQSDADIARVAAELGAEVVNTIGGIAVLYRINPRLQATWSAP